MSKFLHGPPKFSRGTTGWRPLVKCMPQQLYRHGKYRRHTLNRKVGGPQGQSRRFGVDLNFCHYWESNQDYLDVQHTEYSLYQLSRLGLRIFNTGTLNTVAKLLKHICDLRIAPRYEICALLEFHAAWNDSFLPTFRDNLTVPYSRIKLDCLTLEDGTDRLSRNIRKKLPF
jgi:hypothetical protein